MKNFNFINCLTLLLFLFMSVGFKFDQSGKWDIDKDDPTVWLDICDDMYDQDFKNSDVPDDDELKDGDISAASVINSVIADFNDIEKSFLRIALLPDDEDNPGEPAAGDSAYTKKKGKTRTFEVCIENSSNPFQGGHAITYREKGKRVSCEIVLSKATKDNFEPFVQTLTHEIGHCLGLDHNHNTTKSIMSYFLEPGFVRLLGDDKAGISFLYPIKEKDYKEVSNFGLSCTYRK